MPTGSGKTAVMMMTPFLLASRRVLVVTPSRLVRGQIAEQFAKLSLLRGIGVVDPALDVWPVVREVERRITSDDDWQALADADVVVGTVNSVSPGYDAIPSPPPDLFDLILVDEAHHSAARTWNELLQAFPDAKRVLVTATPFRRDSREIRGRIVSTYSARQALDDGIFGQIEYVPVDPAPGGTEAANDIEIAKRAETIFREDREAGFDHRLLVRVDGISRANVLMEIYREQTELNLRVVHSRMSYQTVKRTISALKAGQLDGVICVNMLGEGFDFPNLKIAAIHSPHKSLAVTLQFVGRFARTGSTNIGTAKFLAIPSDIRIETTQLYKEDAAWQEIVPNLLERNIDAAVRAGEILRTFQPVSTPDPDLDDLSLFALEPYHHVKVYELIADVDLHARVDLGEASEVVFQETSDEWDTTIFITREVTRPRWTKGDQLEEVAYDLFLVHHSREHNLLFISSSARSEPLYERLVGIFCPNGALPLTHSQIKRAMRGLQGIEVFNVGMRNRVLNNTAESYRTLAGPSPAKGIQLSDGVRYHEGHVFARAQDGEDDVTIGLSSLSKIWSNTSSPVPQLIDWCDALAARLGSNAPVETGTELDRLGTGQLAAEVPEHVIAADWDKDTYENPCRIAYVDAEGGNVGCQLLDCDVEIDSEASDREHIELALVGPGLHWPFAFHLKPRPHFQTVEQDQPEITVQRAGRPLPLIDYLNIHPIRFYFADFSSLVGREILLPPTVQPQAFDPEQIEAVDWLAENVNMQREFGDAGDGLRSIHDYLGQRLLDEGYDLVLYDHGSGELADYLAVRDEEEAVSFELYHCKGSKEATAGERVGDLYEVCGQVVKSVRWLGDEKRLQNRVKRRLQRKHPSQFKRGDMQLLNQLIATARTKGATYRIVAVQPGVSKAKVADADKLGVLLGMAGEYVVNGYCKELRVIASA